MIPVNGTASNRFALLRRQKLGKKIKHNFSTWRKSVTRNFEGSGHEVVRWNRDYANVSEDRLAWFLRRTRAPSNNSSTTRSAFLWVSATAHGRVFRSRLIESGTNAKPCQLSCEHFLWPRLERLKKIKTPSERRLKKILQLSTIFIFFNLLTRHDKKRRHSSWHAFELLKLSK